MKDGIKKRTLYLLQGGPGTEGKSVAIKRIRY